MAVIVRHLKTRDEYILLGAGYGAYLGYQPNWLLIGYVLSDENRGELPVVLVCDAEGSLEWFASESLEVIKVDGEHPSSVLSRGSSTPPSSPGATPPPTRPT